MQTVNIDVNADVIRESRERLMACTDGNRNCNCPVAVACEKAGLVNVAVSSFDIYHRTDPYAKGVELPDFAREFIRDFDGELDPDPIQFAIQVPDHWLSE